MRRVRVGLVAIGAAAAILALGLSAREVFRDEPAPTGAGAATSAPIAPPPPGLAGSPGRVRTAGAGPAPAPIEPQKPLDPEAWLTKLNGAPTDEDARKALLELGRLPPDHALAVLRAIYSRVEPFSRRQQIIDHFTHMGRYHVHEHAASILDLAVRDPNEEGARWALANAANFALRPLSLDDGTYASWRREILDRRVGDVLTISAHAASRRIAGSDEVDLPRVLKESGDLHAWFAPHHGVETAPIAREEGAWNRCVAAFRSASLPAETRLAALRFLTALGIDHAFAERELLPIVLGRVGAPEELIEAVVPLLVKHGGADGADAAIGAFERFPPDENGDGTMWMVLASALAHADVKRAIPTLIAALDDSKVDVVAQGVLYHNLAKLAAVDSAAPRDAAWWRAWWIENRVRLSPAFATLDVPTLHLQPR